MMRFRWFGAVLLVACAGGSLAFAADEPKGYVLYRVASANKRLGNPVAPRSIVADSDGGRIVADLPYGTSCTEVLEFRWTFDRDIRYLRYGDSFRVGIRAEVDRDCDSRRNPYIKLNRQPASLSPGVRALLSADDYDSEAVRIAESQQVPRIHCKKVTAPGSVYGRASITAMARGTATPADRIWFSLYIEGFSPSGHAFCWDVVYLFRALKSGDRPANDTIVIDSPGPDSKTKVGPRPDDPTQPPDPTQPRDPTQPPDPAKGTRTLLAEERTVEEGQRVVVPVRLLNPDGVANIDYTVTYDASVVVPEGTVIKGSLLAGARMEANTAERGRLRIAFAQEGGLTSDGVVANLSFRAVGRLGDVTALTLAVPDIDDSSGNPLSISRINGRIEIVSESTRGDCDGDGELTMADVICALQMAVGLMEVDLNVDVTGDGRVTSGDARQILQMIP